MTDSVVPEASPRPDIAILDRSDLRHALSMGWKDFRRAPGFGLVFSAVYVLGGLILAFVSGGFVSQTVILALGFPLIAPFAAVGLYETSRRIEEGRPLDLYQIFGVIWREKDRQIPWIGAIIVIYFLFYTFLAHMIFALFMGLSVMTNVTSSLEAFLTPNGLTMIAVELAVGAVLGFILFALVVFSLPLLVDKEIDFMTAMLLSFEAVRENVGIMLLWAILIAVLVVLAMLPLFLGLLVVLPVLGHATWHLYRRALIHPGAPAPAA
ncbi:DUF2189 domain-containing protein [Tropicimonas marinistellae]|uniref:DUF2189 domain-containing protein n=1 Tax=Tropicimonas marinistellae TaxID=1739787 RepID=UPI0008323240|nr:DUF2189 domain-containing protein [Tropicimonas marinistellae]